MVIPSVTIESAPVSPGSENHKVIIGVRSPLPTGKTPCKAKITVTEKLTPPVVSNLNPVILDPIPGTTDGQCRTNISPIKKGTKIKVVVEIIDKDGNVIGTRMIDDWTVGSAGVKFGDNPMPFESEETLPPPPPPPGG